MNYKVVNLNTSIKGESDCSLLIIYTGGTIGMVYDEEGSLAPFNFTKVIERIPELSRFELSLTVISYPNPLDSSNVDVKDWQQLGDIIYKNYDQYDGFVILHGTDTMAYTASALSFMLHGLAKPVILTGAQIPIGHIRSDARENLITAIEIASATDNGSPIVQEVCIYFNFELLRGNRSQKMRSSTFSAFATENYPVLAESGIFIEYNRAVMARPNRSAPLRIHKKFDPNVTILKIFPGITPEVMNSVFSTPGLRGVVMETFGSGNTMNFDWFLDCLSNAISKGIVVYNVSQCAGGEVIQGRYETSKKLDEIGVVGGGDITTEAAVTKLMYLLGTGLNYVSIKEKLANPLNGEMDG